LQFRYRGSRRESAVAQLFSLGGLRVTMKLRTKRIAVAISSLVLAAVGVIVIGIPVLQRAVVKPRELLTYFERLEPGMTYSEAMQIIPRKMIAVEKRHCTNVVWRTVLVHTNATPNSEVVCRDAFGFLPVFETGDIYFDKEDKLIGVYYNSSGIGGGAFWKPKWGVRQE